MATPQNPQSPRPDIPRTALVALSVGILALAGLGLYAVQSGAFASTAALPKGCESRAFAEIGGPFSLVDQDGKATTDRDFLGAPALLYFGFTYCPDICPMSLQTMRVALETAETEAGAATKRIRPVLISLDPARDTPDALKSYVTSSAFPAGLMGLTGSEAQVAAAAKAFKVGYRKTVQNTSMSDYLIDHTSIVYLLNSQGRLETYFSSNADPAEMGQCLAALVKRGL
jgi:protein SCO1